MAQSQCVCVPILVNLWKVVQVFLLEFDPLDKSSMARQEGAVWKRGYMNRQTRYQPGIPEDFRLSSYFIDEEPGAS